MNQDLEEDKHMTQLEAQIRNDKIRRLHGIAAVFSINMIPNDVQSHMSKESLDSIEPLMGDLKQAILKAKHLVRGRPHICEDCFNNFYIKTHSQISDSDECVCQHCNKYSGNQLFIVKRIN